MRQQVRPGGTLDIATPREIGEIIAGAFSAQMVDEYERKKGTIALDATGVGVTSPAHGLAVSAQYDWLLERVTLGGGANAAGAIVKFYENGASDTDMLEVVQLGAVGLYSDSFANRLYVTANSVLLIAVSQGPANGQVTFNLQIALKRHRRAR